MAGIGVAEELAGLAELVRHLYVSQDLPRQLRAGVDIGVVAKAAGTTPETVFGWERAEATPTTGQLLAWLLPLTRRAQLLRASYAVQTRQPGVELVPDVDVRYACPESRCGRDFAVRMPPDEVGAAPETAECPRCGRKSARVVTEGEAA